LPVFGKPNCVRWNGARRTTPNRPLVPTRVTPQSRTTEPQQECEDTILIPAALAAAALAGVGILAAPPAIAGPPYKNCAEAHADGRYSIPSNDSAYRDTLDRDGDGYACEPKPN
jgi:hypothetical protein